MSMAEKVELPSDFDLYCDRRGARGLYCSNDCLKGRIFGAFGRTRKDAARPCWRVTDAFL